MLLGDACKPCSAQSNQLSQQAGPMGHPLPKPRMQKRPQIEYLEEDLILPPFRMLDCNKLYGMLELNLISVSLDALYSAVVLQLHGSIVPSPSLPPVPLSQALRLSSICTTSVCPPRTRYPWTWSIQVAHR